MSSEIIYIVQFLLLLAWSLLFYLSIVLKEYQIRKAKELKELYEILQEFEFRVTNIENGISQAICSVKGSKK